MKNSVKIIVGALLLTTAISGGAYITYSFNNQNMEENKAESVYQYNGHDRVECKFDNVDFYYSDGYFEIDPNEYDNHVASTSMALTKASDTVVVDDTDYSHGPDKVVSCYLQMGFDKYRTYNYEVKPTSDSVAAIVGSKNINKVDGEDIKAIVVTVRSSGYEMEWASNVTLGKSGEAKGFHQAAESVVGYVNNYIDDHGLRNYVDLGKCYFWLNGFSRGGATANLAAKALIDSYQGLGNKVTAYCFEAPQGGVKSEEKSDRNYNCIHNIINVNDLVPYVAPTGYGFKRYGVDHYLFDSSRSDTLKKSKTFPNNLTDTDPEAKPSVTLQRKMNEQLAILLPKEDDRNEQKPYKITNYKLGFGIVAQEKSEATDKYLKRTVDGLAKSLSRSDFESSGLQKALRNVMTFLFTTKANLKNFKNEFKTLDFISMAGDAILPLLAEFIYRVNPFTQLYERIFGKDDKPDMLTGPVRSKLCDIIIDKISYKTVITDAFDKDYPGKTKQAKIDLHTILYRALGGIDTLNDAITLFENITGIFQNHSSCQTLAWLRAKDTWHGTDW